MDAGLEAARLKVEREHSKFQVKLRATRETLKKDLEATSAAVQQYKELIDMKEISEIAHGGAQLVQRLEGFQELAGSINEDEALFG